MIRKSWVLLSILFATTGYATTKEEIREWVKHYDYKDVVLVEAIVQRESGFNPLKFNSEKTGSYGLMQIQCSTAKDPRLESPLKFSCDQLFNPQVNIRYGVMYLKMIESMLENSTPRNIIAAYNAGLEKKTIKLTYCVDLLNEYNSNVMQPIHKSKIEKSCTRKTYKPRRCKNYNVFKYPGFPLMECFPGEYINEAYVWKVHRMYRYLKGKYDEENRNNEAQSKIELKNNGRELI